MPPPRPSSLRPEQVWRSARDPLFWLDPDLRISWVNPAFEELTGNAVDALVGVECLAHGSTGEGDAVDLAAGLSPPPEALTGRAATTTAMLARPSGGGIRRRLAFLPFLDAQGALLGILGRVLDVVEPDPPDAPVSEGHRLRVRLMDARAALADRFGFDALVGTGPAHRRLMEQIRVAAAVRRPVLFVGESGTGKRHAARAVHQLAVGDLTGPSIRAFDCAALPPEVLDRQLFASAADAESEHAATPRLAAVDGSTLLIGDLAAMPRDLQAKLARALEPGDHRVRILAVTTAEPEAAVLAETLHRDLFLALSVMTIRLSPLRERRHDIPLLAQHFLERLNLRGGAQRSGFTAAAESTLTAYHWPGNLRELARVVEHAHGQGARTFVDEKDLPADIRGNLADPYPPPRPAPPRPLDEILTDVERRLIENAMVRARRNKSRAAEILGVSRPRLYRRLKELGFPDVDED